MSVYREGYKNKELIERASTQIFIDACDFGAPTKEGDDIWRAAGQLMAQYGDKKTRKENRYSTFRSVEMEIVLIDEWAVSDERKTMKEATEKYNLSFTSCNGAKCKGKDGYITITKI